ncbi:MAG: insulinase family protein [Comamonadaceae bacterium]|nr:insulinase family protein [Comamonadaceae bacterium]
MLALPLSATATPTTRRCCWPTTCFGGGGNSRLWTRIRETEGLSYDVRSTRRLEPHRRQLAAGPSSAIFAPQNREKVEAAVMAELERARRDGFAQAELDEGRKGLLNLLPAGRAQDAAVAGQLASEPLPRAARSRSRRTSTRRSPR